MLHFVYLSLTGIQVVKAQVLPVSLLCASVHWWSNAKDPLKLGNREPLPNCNISLRESILTTGGSFIPTAPSELFQSGHARTSDFNLSHLVFFRNCCHLYTISVSLPCSSVPTGEKHALTSSVFISWYTNSAKPA